MVKENISTSSDPNDPYPYLAKSTRGTLYGPAEFLTPRQQQFRRANHQEYQVYRKKVNESRGYDVDGCTGFMTGRIAPIHPGSHWWTLATLAARYAAAEDGAIGRKTLRFLRLVKANIQPVAGIIYYVTFEAIHEDDQNKKKTFRSKVWANINRDLERLEFEEVKVSKRTGNGKTISKKKADLKTGKKIVAPVAKARGSSSLKGNIISDGNKDNMEADMGTVCEPKRGALLAKGFFTLLEHLRIQNPSWKYARARTAASKRWRSLPDPEKLIYVTEAEKRLKEK